MSDLTTLMVKTGHVTSAESEERFDRWIASVEAGALRGYADYLEATIHSLSNMADEEDRRQTALEVDCMRNYADYVECRGGRWATYRVGDPAPCTNQSTLGELDPLIGKRIPLSPGKELGKDV